MNRVSANDKYETLVELARGLGINFVGMKKSRLAAKINEAIDQIEREQNEIKFNLLDARDALTETEFNILEQLLNKVGEHKFNLETDARMNELASALLNGKPIWGDPSIGKSKHTLKTLEDAGLNIVWLTDRE